MKAKDIFKLEMGTTFVGAIIDSNKTKVGDIKFTSVEVGKKRVTMIGDMQGLGKGLQFEIDIVGWDNGREFIHCSDNGYYISLYRDYYECSKHFLETTEKDMKFRKKQLEDAEKEHAFWQHLYENSKADAERRQ